ncbi:MAG TPA: hypothetical protein VM010_02175 [Chitinophagaceae bacterium]|nr:hypothetical protein [Chitinophagaceae bacterium]
MASPRSNRARNWILSIGAVLLLLLGLFSVFINRYIEPVLRDRIHTLIIQGSDSLYAYNLGSLNANFFGGSVEVRNLHIHPDSTRYMALAGANALPALTLELDLVRGQIKGLDLFDLLFNKQIAIEEIVSKDADIRLLRHIRQNDVPKNTPPLWKMVQPSINGIAVNRINLDGVKLLYRNADTSDAIKLQFDKCIGLFDDIRIDSLASADTTRIAFTKSINLQFNDLKFRTPDSSYKMKADVISYSSRANVFEVVNFKIQPTLKDKDEFYAAATRQKTMYVIEYDRMKLTNIRLDRFLNNNIIAADTVFIEHPVTTLYNDKSLPPVFDSKIGSYPHQQLLKASTSIIVKAVLVKNAELQYTEKASKTGQEGTLALSDLNIEMQNVTNDANAIKRNRECLVNASGKILGNSPMQVQFHFYLDDTSGRFTAAGDVKNVSANQLNALAEPLANVKLQSFNMKKLDFTMQGDDYSATSNVTMRYDNLFVLLQKQNEETGAVKTKKFMTKLLNRFTLQENNPGPDGVLRKAVGAQRSRISSQSFFGLVWKSLFTGMQEVMMKTGRFE